MRTELGDQSIRLLGYGHIGKAIAARAKAFGMAVSVANRTKVPVGGLVDTAALSDASAAFSGAEPGMQPVLEWVQPATGVNLPTRVEKVEHHPFSDQTFLPHSAAPFLVVVCPARPDGAPDATAARAFIVPATTGVTFRRGVRHRSLAPLATPSAFTMSMARTGRGDNTVIVTLDTAVVISG